MLSKFVRASSTRYSALRVSLRSSTPKSDVSEAIQVAGKLCGEENAGQDRLRDRPRQDAAQHLLGTMAIVLALSMCKMDLNVVIVYKLAMRFFDFLPTCCTIEIIISDSPHNTEVSLNVG